jgi:hypothetical protein
MQRGGGWRGKVFVLARDRVWVLLMVFGVMHMIERKIPFRLFLLMRIDLFFS